MSPPKRRVRKCRQSLKHYPVASPDFTGCIQIRSALEAAGIDFIDKNGGGPASGFESAN